jgi:AmmeMemoRadiSam system protein B
MNTRSPAVAGLFYPDNPQSLRKAVKGFLDHVKREGKAPKAMIVPHAGYIYSGPIAASAYARLVDMHERIKRVVLLGPAHRVAFYGLAAPTAAFFETPLGRVPIDNATIANIRQRFPQVVLDDRPHAQEHSLEVHLPFLQLCLDDFELIPLVVGRCRVTEVSEVLQALWGGDETLIVISSDLSHYHDYDTARTVDAKTSEAIEALQGERLGPEDACGYLPVRGLLQVVQEKGLQVHNIDLRNSGDTAGSRDRVVGYGAYVVE